MNAIGESLIAPILEGYLHCNLCGISDMLSNGASITMGIIYSAKVAIKKLSKYPNQGLFCIAFMSWNELVDNFAK